MDIKLTSLTHAYNKDKRSLNEITLTFGPGVTGLLGVNGAGKSSLLNIIATTMKPIQGSYSADGIDVLKNPFEIRKQLGFLPQYAGCIPELSIVNFLQYAGALKGCNIKGLNKRIMEVLEYFNLLDLKDRKIKELSGGMKQRVGIAQAIINKPRLLILDEPVAGLDPNERNNFGQLLSELAQDTTIILSSHIIDDIENMCEKVALLDNGQLKYAGSVQDLLDRVDGLVQELLIERTHFEEFKNSVLVTKVKSVKEGILVRYLSDVRTGSVITPSLEDAFVFSTRQKEVGK